MNESSEDKEPDSSEEFHEVLAEQAIVAAADMQPPQPVDKLLELPEGNVGFLLDLPQPLWASAVLHRAKRISQEHLHFLQSSRMLTHKMEHPRDELVLGLRRAFFPVVLLLLRVSPHYLQLLVALVGGVVG